MVLMGFEFSWAGKRRNIQNVFVLVSHNAVSSGPICLVNTTFPSKKVTVNLLVAFFKKVMANKYGF